MKKYLMITAVIAAIIGTSWYGFAKGYKKEESTSVTLDEAGFQLAVDESTGVLNNKDKQIIAEIQQLFAGFTGDVPLFIKGAMKAEDPSDTVESMPSTSFVYYCNAGIVYYANDDQILLNDSLAYVVADKESKQLLVMPPRTIITAQASPLGELSKLLKDDHYRIERKEEDGLITFQLLNENHISCKEMRIQVKAETKTPLSIYYRMTDIEHPEDKAWDKQLTMDFTAWQTGEKVVTYFVVPRLIQKLNDGFKPSREFESFSINDLSSQ